jgi:DNA-binding PadR family transcriptional regulator
MITAPEIKVTRATRRVLAVLLSDATNLSGWPLAQLAKVTAGTLYVILARLENAGLVTSEWEQRDDADDDEPRRRFYRLTPDGWVWAWDVLGLHPPGVRRG